MGIQDVLTLAILASTGAYLARRALGAWRPEAAAAAGGCGGGCSGCPSAASTPTVVSIGPGPARPGNGLT